MAKKTAARPKRNRGVSRETLVQQVADLQQMLAKQDLRTAEVEKHRDRLFDERGEALARAGAAEKKLEESRGHFGDLKEQLFNAEILNARMQGYIDRVASDDIARDEPVQIGERTLAEIQPRRPRPPFAGLPGVERGESPSAYFAGRPRDTAGDSLGGRKSGHWTTWG